MCNRKSTMCDVSRSMQENQIGINALKRQQMLTFPWVKSEMTQVLFAVSHLVLLTVDHGGGMSSPFSLPSQKVFLLIIIRLLWLQFLSSFSKRATEVTGADRPASVRSGATCTRGRTHVTDDSMIQGVLKKIAFSVEHFLLFLFLYKKKL